MILSIPRQVTNSEIQSNMFLIHDLKVFFLNQIRFGMIANVCVMKLKNKNIHELKSVKKAICISILHINTH